MSRVCLRFELPIENTDSKSLIFRSYRRYSVLSRRSRNESLYYRWCIDLSIGTSGKELFTDGKLPLPSVPSVPMDKVFEGYLMPLK